MEFLSAAILIPSPPPVFYLHFRWYLAYSLSCVCSDVSGTAVSVSPVFSAGCTYVMEFHKNRMMNVDLVEHT